MAQHPITASRAPKKEPEKDLIPIAMVRAMIGIAVLSLVIVAYSVLTNRPHVGVPEAGKIVAEREVILEDVDSQHVIVRNADGSVLVDMPDGGFVNVVGAALARTREVQRVTGNPPVRIVQYDNKRLTLEDPVTGWSAELYAFGEDSKAAFERLLAMK
ncbi:putative photosynthetic complex assembly protein [Rhodobacter aestuarii]|uniref:Putative photosynthetic complex assembly protein n=1 Tax=Rhodobacter aestuarii TaxID=453582 RepID=A0A1N7MLW8_9RHOB|nr:photosynthetic complex assembly protein PuhC [Rhodobacter aestuarii]PTV96674.1 putative photosynthetic complex assembly protein [Rhodobacter aestuarii]SIS86998.1 putative photosynthetic complex assembly protein [Rhodobacter aestuarii]